jgi:hypothetical protein
MKMRGTGFYSKKGVVRVSSVGSDLGNWEKEGIYLMGAPLMGQRPAPGGPKERREAMGTRLPYPEQTARYFTTIVQG